jgi:hypothetical protein
MWARVLNVAVGIWLMAAPAALRYEGTLAADHDRVVGPVLASFACIAMWEVTRPLRWGNAVIGAWLLAAPWVLGFPPVATVNSMAAGAVVVGLSLVRGKLTHDFAGGWASLLPGRRIRDGAA